MRRLRWAVTDSGLLFRSGWFWRDTSFAPFNRIQNVAILESPCDRRAGMASLRVDTAGAGSPLSHKLLIPYLARATADELAELLAARAASSAFEW